MSSPRRYHAPIREAQAQLTRERIRAAAIELFRQRGYAATTVADLAAAAGLSVPTLYAAFGSKRGVAKAVIEGAIDQTEIGQLIEQALATTEPRLQLAIAARVTRRILERGGTLLELLGRAGNEELLDEWRSWEERRYRGQRSIVQSLEAKQVLRADLSATRAADVLWMLTGRDVFRMLVQERGWSPARYERWLSDALARELLA